MQELVYQHHGEIEVGKHTLHVAVLEAGHAFPTVLSEQRFFEYEARQIDVQSLTSALRSRSERESDAARHEPQDFDACAIGQQDSCALIRCIVQREASTPPNRQVRPTDGQTDGRRGFIGRRQVHQPGTCWQRVPSPLSERCALESARPDGSAPWGADTRGEQARRGSHSETPP